MNTSKKVLPLVQLCARQFSRSGIARAEQVQEVPSKSFYRMKEKQKKFGVDDGTPVYIKGGFGDKALYIVTSTLVLIATGFSLEAFYRVATK